MVMTIPEAINLAEIRLKEWLIKKHLCKPNINLKIFKATIDSPVVVSINGHQAGTGLLNTREGILENFKFNKPKR